MEHLDKQPRHAALKAKEASLARALGKVNARLAEVSASLTAHAPRSQDESQVAAALKCAETSRVIPVVALLAEQVLLRSQASALRHALSARQSEVGAFPALTYS